MKCVKCLTSTIEKLFIVCNLEENDPSASGALAKFLCLLPCLTDLTMMVSDELWLHDDFYHELALLASSSKIEKLDIACNLWGNDPTASRALAKFLWLLPCLTDLTIGMSDKLWLHDDFYHELALLASSSKIEMLDIACNLERNHPTALRAFAKFLCLLPCLTDLTMFLYYKFRLHDDFYHELALLASSSKIEKLYIASNLERNHPTALRAFAKFLCLLPCLTDLMMSWSEKLHDDFYDELAVLAPSSKIEKLHISCNLKGNDPTASRAFAKFLCLLPCLTDLRMSGSEGLHDDFYDELALLASSSKNPFFKKKLHLDESSKERKEMDLGQLTEYIRCLVHTGSVQQQIEYPSFVTPPDLDTPSTSGINAQSGKILEAQPPSVNQSFPSKVDIQLDAANSSCVTDNAFIGQITGHRYSDGSEDDSLGERPRKRKKKTNRKTDSTDEDD